MGADSRVCHCRAHAPIESLLRIHPVADGTRVVVWHGSAGVFCYDFDGQELWKKDLGETRHDWGYASSPILHGTKLILNFGPGSRTFLAALDLKRGDLHWKRDEPGGLDATDKRMVGSWSTPIVIKVDGKDQILCSMPTRVIACDPETGSVLWSCGGLANEKADLVYASPVVSGAIGVAFTGWVNGPTIGFKMGGSGDVTTSNRLWLEAQQQRRGMIPRCFSRRMRLDSFTYCSQIIKSLAMVEMVCKRHDGTTKRVGNAL